MRVNSFIFGSVPWIRPLGSSRRTTRFSSQHRFRPFAGDDAKWQPADLAEVFMHETVAAWIRRYFQMHPVTKDKSLDENRESPLAGLASCEKYISQKYKVESLCNAMPKRVETMLKPQGDRLGKGPTGGELLSKATKHHSSLISHQSSRGNLLSKAGGIYTLIGN